MKKIWCWRCKKEVKMLDEIEFSDFNIIYKECTEKVKLYRKENKVLLSQVPLNKIYQPTINKFERITEEKVKCSFDHLLKHRISLYGKLCIKCGKPLRTSKAKFCANCGHISEKE